jgi:radical SAM protein with 4Fe4S-binding SPASM domain
MDPKESAVFLDPNIPRKKRELEKHLEAFLGDGITAPFFSLIEFNLSGLCNRTCVFCPRSDPKVFPNVNKHIPIELYESIMTDLGAADYDGMILYSAFSEPLLYKRIEYLIELSKKLCPKVRIESVTDGDFVTPEKLKSLFGAGLDTLLISMYDGPEQELQFQSIVTESGVSADKVVLRKRWLPPEEHYGITLSNRAGMIELPQAGVGKLTEPLKRACHYPFYQVLVDYDGAVLMCPHDWGKKLIVGNVNDTSIVDLWNSPSIKRARLNLSRKDRNFSPCDLCDVDGTLMGQSHFDKWMAYYKQNA